MSILACKRPTDGDIVPLKFDHATSVLATVDHEHQKIHEGAAFTASFKADVAGGGVMDILIVTPNTTKYAHFTYEIECELETDILFYEAPTATAAANPIVAYNRDRNSATAATVVITHTPTSITEGTTIIRSSHVGSGKSYGGGERATHEFILKKNTKYLLRLTNAVSNATNQIAVKLDWYEHENVV